MRNKFIRIIEDLARQDKNVYLLTADLGFKLFDNFKEKYPGQFINVGVAEANLVGLSAGLSLSGKKVYCYSIIPFLTMRAYEQVRVDIAYHNLNVTLLGVGGGFTYGLEGFTHFGLEDLSLMKGLPNMTVVEPADEIEAKKLAEISYSYSSPLYIRLGRGEAGNLHETDTFDFKIGKGIILAEGLDVAIFAIGSMVAAAKRAKYLLKQRGISVRLINMHTLKPLDTELIKETAKICKAVFSVEEHNLVGGLGSALAEFLLEQGYQGTFGRIGIPEKLTKGIIGGSSYLRDYYGLTPEKICQTVLAKLRR